MKSLGYKYREVQKGVYLDGHERDDVVAGRQTFLETMAARERRMPQYTEDSNTIIWPTLEDNERPLILVTHDESIFYAYDGQKKQWLPNGEQPLRKKGTGHSLHVSEFLTDVCGRLALADDNTAAPELCPRETSVIMKPGKNHDGWWTSDDLVDQVMNRAIPSFERRFPHAHALFAFENATSHAAFAEDALRAQLMNLGRGGKQPRMRM